MSKHDDGPPPNPIDTTRRIPPHGDVSPDGRRIWPRPSSGDRLIAWGGTAIVAAAATAGTVLVLRHLAGQSAPPRKAQQEAPPPHSSPADHPRSSAPAKPARGADNTKHRPRPKPKKRPQHRSLIGEIEDTSQRLTHSLDGVISSLGGAFAGFCKVASQTGNIMRDFGDAADMIRTVMTPRPPAKDRSDPPKAPPET